MSPGANTEISPNTEQTIWFGTEKRISWISVFRDAESKDSYVSFHIMDIDVRDKAMLKERKKTMTFLPGMMFTIKDIEALDWSLTYPPTAEMSLIHMYLGE